MHKRYISIILTGSIMLLLVAMAGCRRSSTQVSSTQVRIPSTGPTVEVIKPTATFTKAYPPSSEVTPSLVASQAYPPPVQVTSTQQAASPTSQPTKQIGSTVSVALSTPTSSKPTASATITATHTPEATLAQSLSTATSTATIAEGESYPGPETTVVQAYPGPETTNTPVSSPGAGTATLQPTRTQAGSATPTPAPGGTTSPTPTPTPGTGTPAGTPTELPPRPPLSPPPAGSNVVIWHSWGTAEADMLRSIIQSFQKLYPDVTFSLSYIPLDDLLSTYQEASYLGQGPSLLLGPAQWGPQLFAGGLVSDLTSYIPANYLSSVNPAALALGRSRASLIFLPLSQHGMVMFRNVEIIPSAPKTYDELIRFSRQATRAGIVGSYLERGSYFSAADLLGLGGRLTDDDLQPVFDDRFGLEWIGLLQAYDEAGAVTFNTNRDLDMFKRGRVGIIIDGTWNIEMLKQAMGPDKLAIDPWPTYGSGHMSGWVEADGVFLNSNTTGNDRFAALAFIGYLLDPNVQLRLAEVGHIPSILGTKPRDSLIQQAMAAFSNGVPYPMTIDDNVLAVYWRELDDAIRNIFVNHIDPAQALRTASDEIRLILLNSPTVP